MSDRQRKRLTAPYEGAVYVVAAAPHGVGSCAVAFPVGAVALPEGGGGAVNVALPDGAAAASFTMSVAEPLMPVASVALIVWLPLVISAGMVALAVNVPLASVCMGTSGSRVSLSIISVAF